MYDDMGDMKQEKNEIKWGRANGNNRYSFSPVIIINNETNKKKVK